MVAFNNHSKPVHRWLVVTEEIKCAFVGRTRDTVRIEGLSDRADEPLWFRHGASRWDSNFGQVHRFLQWAELDPIE